MIGIINFGYGNIQSIINALDEIEVGSKVIKNPKDILKFSKIILPGVGSFKTCFQELVKMGWKHEIHEYLNKEKYLLGICLGMQLMFEWGEEDRGSEGLNLFKGKVSKLKVSNLEKVPHVGWNNISLKKKSHLFKNINEDVDYYFTHSYMCVPENKSDITATFQYGLENVIVASVSNEKNIYGTQFHPEKSPPNGLRILKNFDNL